MSLLQAILLGIVQGLTEFLPVSSSGHLVLLQHLLHFKDSAVTLAFDVALHFGTLLAVVLFFWRDLLAMLRESLAWIFRTPRSSAAAYPSARLMILVGVATLPAVVVGLGFKDPIEELFVSPKVAGFGLLITGTLLWITRKVASHFKEAKDISVRDSLLIGLAQAVAITPGISRSGSTIAAGLFCRLDQRFAARFSFLLSIPAILGSVILELPELKALGLTHLFPVILGTLASFLTGLLAIRWLLAIIGRGKLHLFSFYCWAAGLLTLFLLSV